MNANKSNMLELPSDKHSIQTLNKTFNRFNSPTKNINIQSVSPPSTDDQFYTPGPTPSTSKHSITNTLKLMPSISCKSNFSVQTFHTALGDSDDEENIHPHTKLNTINEKTPLNTSNPVKEDGETPNIKPNNQRHNMSRTSSTANGLHSYHPTAIPVAASASNSFMVHPMSAVPSNGSMLNNFYYYGSLDSGMLSNSPAGSYFYDYFSEDYEVVLDDGTRQKRSVSLSTIPIDTPMEVGKRKYKGHYNHFYYDQQHDDETDEQHKQRIASKSQANE